MAAKTYTLQDAIGAEARVLRAVWQMPIRSEILALCEDGEVRMVQYGVADTFFTAPAKARIGRRTVYGFITHETLEGYSTPSDDDPAVCKFIAANDDVQHESRKSYQESIRP